MKTNFLLGAGFSYNAGLPLVKDISDRFLREPLYEQIIDLGSGEWKWADLATEIDKANDSGSHDSIKIAMFLQTIIHEFFTIDNKNILNYEEFYNYLWGMLNNRKEEFDQNRSKIDELFLAKFDVEDTFPFSMVPSKEIFSCFYHLVEDLLWLRKDREKIYSLYKPYVDFFSATECRVDIFTLNHDLLLETIFEHFGLAFKDGFTNEESPLSNENGVDLPVFSNNFGSGINLIKLHGSIDTYKYQYFLQHEQRKDFEYFKTLDYWEKQMAVYRDSQGAILQNVTPDVTPQFITGQNKLMTITSDKMYRSLYSRFENSMKSTERLIIVGYSFCDEHINSVIKESLGTLIEVININPSDFVPFELPNYKLINPLVDAVDFEYQN